MNWQPIETAPKDGTDVLVVIAGCHPTTKKAVCASRGFMAGWVGIVRELRRIRPQLLAAYPLDADPRTTGGREVILRAWKDELWFEGEWVTYVVSSGYTTTRSESITVGTIIDFEYRKIDLQTTFRPKPRKSHPTTAGKWYKRFDRRTRK